jgi:flagellar basal-body rod modification protein FlgD
MSIVGEVSPYRANEASGESNSKNTSKTTDIVDKTEFLELLVAQLKHQDPMNPVNNEQFITQLATFSSLEQLISINEAVSKLAGDPVQTETPDSGATDQTETPV